MKSFHRLFTRSIIVVSMNLKDVDIVGVKTLKTCLNSLKDVFATQSYLSE